MLILMGDLHGNFFPIEQLMDRVWPDVVSLYGESANKEFAVLQVGDFGFYPQSLLNWPEPPFPVYAIDGNHEYFPLFDNISKVTEISKNLFYVPRGIILSLMGYKIGCCGGGFSIDKAFRQNGVSWWPQEEVKQADINPLLDADVDFLVVHTPPSSIIKKSFPPLDPAVWRLPNNWVDTSAEKIEQLYQKNPVKMFCGHMHKSVTVDRVQILAEAEIKILPKKVV